MFNSLKVLNGVGGAVRVQAVTVLLGTAVLLLSTPLAASNDPTRPPAGFGTEVIDNGHVPGALPTVTAILRAANRRLALIDGELAGVGDSVSGGSILQIERNHVLLRIDNKTVRLGVAAQGIRRHPSSGER